LKLKKLRNYFNSDFFAPNNILFESRKFRLDLSQKPRREFISPKLHIVEKREIRILKATPVCAEIRLGENRLKWGPRGRGGQGVVCSRGMGYLDCEEFFAKQKQPNG